MDLQSAMVKRLAEREERRRAEEIKSRSDRAEREQREMLAARAIQLWIERLYDVTLAPGQVQASEARRVGESYVGYYNVEVIFSDDELIRANRQILFDGSTVWPEENRFDAPERGAYSNLWHAVRGNLFVDYHDFIDAAIYVTGADDPPPLSEAELVDVLNFVDEHV